MRLTPLVIAMLVVADLADPVQRPQADPIQRPPGWRAGIGIVQDVQLSTVGNKQYITLVYSDGRRVDVINLSDAVNKGHTIPALDGPEAHPDYHAPCDQILSVKEAEEASTP